MALVHDPYFKLACRCAPGSTRQYTCTLLPHADMLPSPTAMHCKPTSIPVLIPWVCARQPTDGNTPARPRRICQTHGDGFHPR